MNFREKAREIKAAGEAERGNFEPNGVPLRMYNYWLENSNSRRARDVRGGSTRENFCHFWRVVAIWAPFMFIRRKVTAVVDHPATLVILAGLILAGIVYGGFNYQSFLNMLIIIGIAAVGLAVIAGIIALIVTNWRESWTDKIESALPFIMGGMLAIGTIGFLTIGVIEEGWIFLPIAFGIAVGVVALLLGLAFTFIMISDYISGRRKIAEDKETERVRAARDAGEDPYPTVVREPGKIAKFFSGLGDFIVFVSQIVRVNKWKICPMVDINAGK